MSSKRYAAPLLLEIERSRRLASVVILSVAGATILPFAVPLPVWMRLLVVAAVAGLSYRIYRDYFGTGRISRAVWDENGVWRLWLAKGEERTVRLEGDSFVTPEVLILNFREEGRRRYHLVVLKDVLHPMILRRLRVRLRLEGISTDASGNMGALQ